MNAKDWIDIMDNLFWWILCIGFILWIAGVFDKD